MEASAPKEYSPCTSNCVETQHLYKRAGQAHAEAQSLTVCLCEQAHTHIHTLHTCEQATQSCARSSAYSKDKYTPQESTLTWHSCLDPQISV